MTNLKIAVVSDIHGFSIALDHVLADISTHEVDHIVIAGDLVESGPDPLGVLERVLDLNCAVIQGNTDYDIAKQHRHSKTSAWTEAQIGKEGREYLLNLPFEHRITPPGADSASQDLLVVHANPDDFMRPIAPDATEEELGEIIGDTRAGVIAFGHIHIAYTRDYGDTKLIDVSAVGNPKDGDFRSKWGEITWDTDSYDWTTQLHYVEYPIEETEVQMHASGIPKPDKKIRKLKKASYS